MAKRMANGKNMGKGKLRSKAFQTSRKAQGPAGISAASRARAGRRGNAFSKAISDVDIDPDDLPMEVNRMAKPKKAKVDEVMLEQELKDEKRPEKSRKKANYLLDAGLEEEKYGDDEGEIEEYRRSGKKAIDEYSKDLDEEYEGDRRKIEYDKDMLDLEDEYPSGKKGVRSRAIDSLDDDMEDDFGSDDFDEDEDIRRMKKRRSYDY